MKLLGYFNWTPLNIAIQNGNFKVFAFLCSLLDIDVNVADYSGYTPLHLCAQRNYMDYVSILVNHKDCKLDPKLNNGIRTLFFNKTPLDLARSYNQQEMVDFLVKLYKDHGIECNAE